MRAIVPALLMLLFISPVTTGLTTEEDGDNILSKIHPTMTGTGIEVVKGRITSGSEYEKIDVLIHVREDRKGSTRFVLENFGIDVGYRFSGIDVYQARLKPGILSDLTMIDEVMLIEWDAPGTFDLDVSTETVMAPRVWSSLIMEGSGMNSGISGKEIGIAVVDSGIDAGHPDLDFGKKTIKNIKAVRAGDPWIEMENTDTSVGHGSHCAGIAAGNGEASAGSRRGVAPAATLIGLSLTEGDEQTSPL
jgi:serine protease AprX